jgi:hypothetical protein
MITSNQPSIYASSTTEDDGWVEGDDDNQGEISSQEELEEAYEGSQWEDDIGSNEFEEATDNDDENDDDENDDELVECEDGSLVETEELCDQSEALVTCSDGSSAATQAECPPELESSFVTCSDGSSAATQAECPPEPEAAQEQLQTCPDGSEECPPEPEPLPEEQLTCPDGSVVSINEACPPTDKPLSDCDGSFQDCITPYGDVCPAGSAAHECELPEPVSRELPDNDCLFNMELAKCASVNGECPDGFGMNEDYRCFKEHPNGCPDGYHTTEDDETGECNLNSECVDDDYLLVNDDKSCREKRTYCLETPTPDECKDKDKNKEQNDIANVVHKTTVIRGASASASATATATTNAAEVSSCKLDGNAHGMQQKFDIAKYRACGLYPNGQIAYTDGFVMGCTQVGNTQQLCQAFVVMNTQQTQIAAIQSQTQPIMQSTIEPTQTQPLTQPTQAIQPSDVS